MYKAKRVTHDIQGRPLSPEVSDVLTAMAQGLADKGLEYSKKGLNKPS